MRTWKWLLIWHGWSFRWSLGLTLWAVRRGTVRIAPLSAMMVTLLVCFLLLPIISVSDDLMEARQAALPLSAQTWHMAAEGASVGIEVIPMIGSYLLLLGSRVSKGQTVDEKEHERQSMEAWLTPSQRLRPPPTSLV